MVYFMRIKPVTCIKNKSVNIKEYIEKIFKANNIELGEIENLKIYLEDYDIIEIYFNDKDKYYHIWTGDYTYKLTSSAYNFYIWSDEKNSWMDIALDSII